MPTAHCAESRRTVCAPTRNRRRRRRRRLTRNWTKMECDKDVAAVGIY